MLSTSYPSYANYVFVVVIIERNEILINVYLSLHSKARKNPNFIDLHGLTVKEALVVVKEELERWSSSSMQSGWSALTGIRF